MQEWIEQYAAESGDNALRRLVDAGHDVRHLVREHAVKRWFPQAWLLPRTAHYEERVSPRAEALDLLEELKVAVQIVNEFQLGDGCPLRVELLDRVLRVHERGSRFTGCVAVVKMDDLPDLHIAWSAEGRMEPRGSMATPG